MEMIITESEKLSYSTSNVVFKKDGTYTFKKEETSISDDSDNESYIKEKAKPSKSKN